MEPVEALSSDLSLPVSKVAPGQIPSPTLRLSLLHSLPDSAVLDVCCCLLLWHLSEGPPGLPAITECLQVQATPLVQ